MVKQVTTLDEYNQILNTGKPVAVDFYADWCGPCKFIGPKFAKLAETHGDNITFLKVDVDKANEITQKVGINCMPTFKFYKDGKLVETLEGASEEKLNQHLQSLLS